MAEAAATPLSSDDRGRLARWCATEHSLAAIARVVVDQSLAIASK
jgi:hypothetical protein